MLGERSKQCGLLVLRLMARTGKAPYVGDRLNLVVGEQAQEGLQ